MCPVSLLPEVWEYSFGHNDDAKKIVLDLSAKVGERGIFHGAYIPIAGIIDKHVQAAKGPNRFVDGAPGLRFVGDIQRDSSHSVRRTCSQCH